ncbi:TetR/AcrR family transcriptional regulator [Nocardia implantans]|uniref:Helix-turn-helix domain-containing protein n=1 Tax=Nocardia implantans TaxID=3108168 RepID=A0ABU6B2G4_9NOCA|nr:MULTISPECIES: TetR/AcrR family transcriptional regulator [unclassified Nocardia]MBF6195903.1 TetR/AcrR family transcriptional regulator [Nocardia beijingensis]MEA3531783.1 helix-turn-helix domain-containing protein [Nocardia sp. CDC192]MEB3513948.1 helix-turn-helix domain-containing protein [Nocardia sp. CDC186]
MTEPAKSRRAEYAEATRAAIIDAARELFARQGYFATTVDEIAKQARVAPATVYAVGGGKQGLLRTLVDLWSEAPVVAETLERQETLTDPGEIVRHAAATVRSMRENYGDIMRVVLATAPHNAEAGDALRIATKRYRDAIAALALRLNDVGGLPPDTTVEQATDILWFYFGYSGYFTLVDDNDWTFDRAERWLAEQALAALRRSTE